MTELPQRWPPRRDQHDRPLRQQRRRRAPRRPRPRSRCRLVAWTALEDGRLRQRTSHKLSDICYPHVSSLTNFPTAHIELCMMLQYRSARRGTATACRTAQLSRRRPAPFRPFACPTDTKRPQCATHSAQDARCVALSCAEVAPATSIARRELRVRRASGRMARHSVLNMVLRQRRTMKPDQSIP